MRRQRLEIYRYLGVSSVDKTASLVGDLKGISRIALQGGVACGRRGVPGTAGRGGAGQQDGSYHLGASEKWNVL